MPVPGQRIDDPSTGNAIEFLETGASSNGERVVIRQYLHQKGPIVPLHMHAFQSEQFDVESGDLTCVTGGKSSTYSKGQSVRFSPGTFHNHYNISKEPVVFLHITEPALDFDVFLENLFNLMADGRIVNGKVSFWQNVAAQSVYQSKAYLAFPPVAVQKILTPVLAPVARLLGYRGVYAKYSGYSK